MFLRCSLLLIWPKDDISTVYNNFHNYFKMKYWKALGLNPLIHTTNIRKVHNKKNSSSPSQIPKNLKVFSVIFLSSGPDIIPTSSKGRKTSRPELASFRVYYKTITHNTKYITEKSSMLLRYQNEKSVNQCSVHVS